HAEAHAKALHGLAATRLPPHLAALFRELDASHRAQELQFSRLAIAPEAEWASRARALREHVHQHHEFERTWCVPVLRARLSTYAELAPRYATERLRALGWSWQPE